MAENQPEDVSNLEESAKGFDASLLDKDPAELTPDQVKEIQKSSKTNFALRQHWRGKAIEPTTKKPYAELLAEKDRESQQPINKTSPPAGGDDEIRTTVAELKSAEEKRQFGHANHLSPEETDRIFAFALGMKKQPSEVLKDPFMVNALETHRQQERNGSATPGPSNRSPKVEGKTFGEMDDSEKKKNFSGLVRTLTKK